MYDIMRLTYDRIMKIIVGILLFVLVGGSMIMIVGCAERVQSLHEDFLDGEIEKALAQADGCKKILKEAEDRAQEYREEIIQLRHKIRELESRRRAGGEL